MLFVLWTEERDNAQVHRLQLESVFTRKRHSGPLVNPGNNSMKHIVLAFAAVISVLVAAPSAHAEVGDVTTSYCQYRSVTEGQMTIDCQYNQTYQFLWNTYNSTMSVYAFPTDDAYAPGVTYKSGATRGGAGSLSGYDWAWIATNDWNYICALATGNHVTRVDCVQMR